MKNKNIAIAILLLMACANTQGQESGAQPEVDRREIEEVLVTATKREKSVRDIPTSIDAFSAEELENQGASGFEDFIKYSPGVSFNPSSPDRASISVRGVATETSGQVTSVPTGLFFDDIPLANPSLVNSRPAVEVFDLRTVEVLKGPQGTLFGGSALAGAVRFVPETPDFESMSAKFLAAGSRMEHSDDQGRYLAAMLNLPLHDTLAVRIAATDRESPGYIDDTRRNKKDIDSSRVQQQRAMIAFEPIDSLLFQYTYQNIEIEADDISFADNTQNFSRDTTSGESPLAAQIEIHSGKIQYETPWFSVIGILSELDKPRQQRLNVDRVTGTQDLGDVGRQTSTFETTTKTRELRFVSSPDFDIQWGPLKGVEWLVGYFNMRSDQLVYTDIDVNLTGLSLLDISVLGSLLNPILPTALETIAYADAEEDAIFLDTTFYLGERWELNLGLRRFDQTTDGGAIAYGAGVENTRAQNLTVEKGTNPKIAITWKPLPNLSLYVSSSEGFRFGGVNAIIGPNLDGAPTFYDSDELRNTEYGVRSEWFDNRLVVDATVFNIDWERLQIRQRGSDGINQFLDNVGRAESEGAELSLKSVLPWGFFAAASASRITAETRAAFESVDGEVAPGTALPGTPKHQRSLILNHTLPLGNWVLDSSLRYAYHGESYNNLQHDYTLSAYETFDAGVHINNESLKFKPSISLNISNLKNEKSVTNIVADAGTSGFQDLYFNRPRVVTLQLSFEL